MRPGEGLPGLTQEEVTQAQHNAGSTALIPVHSLWLSSDAT